MMLRRLGGPWPTPPQELLLRAALARGDAAVDAWRRWARITDVETLDAGSARLLALLYRTLADAGVPDSKLSKLKGVYRHTWSRNQLHLHHGAGAIRALAAARIDTMILKGAALATTYYRDLGVRPMNDFDVLVRRDRVLEAMDVLRSSGWRPWVAQPQSRLAARHAELFVDDRGSNLDVHWDAMWQASDDSSFWDCAFGTRVNGVATLAPGHADQLTHVCVHGMRWAPVEPIRWVADAMKIIEVAGPRLDWARLVGSARSNHLTLALEHALSYLRDAFEAPVPGEVVADLRAAPRPLFERIAFRAGMRRPNPARQLPVIWDRHRRRALIGGDDRPSVSFIGFLQQHWEIERPSQLPAQALRRLSPVRWQRRN